MHDDVDAIEIPLTVFVSRQGQTVDPEKRGSQRKWRFCEHKCNVKKCIEFETESRCSALQFEYLSVELGLLHKKGDILKCSLR